MTPKPFWSRLCSSSLDFPSLCSVWEGHMIFSIGKKEFLFCFCKRNPIWRYLCSKKHVCEKPRNLMHTLCGGLKVCRAVVLIQDMQYGHTSNDEADETFSVSTDIFLKRTWLKVRKLLKRSWESFSRLQFFRTALFYRKQPHLWRDIDIPTRLKMDADTPVPRERGRSMKVVASTTPTTNGLSVTVSTCIQHHESKRLCTLTQFQCLTLGLITCWLIGCSCTIFLVSYRLVTFSSCRVH